MVRFFRDSLTDRRKESSLSKMLMGRSANSKPILFSPTDFGIGIGGGIEHLPLDSGHGGGSSYGGSAHGLDGGHGHGHGGGGGSLDGSDYHHGVSVVSIPAGKPQTFDLTAGRKLTPTNLNSWSVDYHASLPAFHTLLSLLVSR